MEKIEAIVAIGMGIKEILGEVVNFFGTSIPNGYYDTLDLLTFLNCETIGFSSDGRIIDSTNVIYEAIYGLSNFVVWGILLFYLFFSLFGYFLSQKIVIPWENFIRLIICGVLINSSLFICFSAVYFTENATDYIIEFCGGETSFSYFKDMSGDMDIIIDEELENDFSIDGLIKFVTYILMFCFNIASGARFILVKTFVVFSPIVFALGCNKNTEKILIKLFSFFIKLLVYQVVVAVILEVVSRLNINSSETLRIIVLSTMVIFIRFIKKIY